MFVAQVGRARAAADLILDPPLGTMASAKTGPKLNNRGGGGQSENAKRHQASITNSPFDRSVQNAERP